MDRIALDQTEHGERQSSLHRSIKGLIMIGAFNSVCWYVLLVHRSIRCDSVKVTKRCSEVTLVQAPLANVWQKVRCKRRGNWKLNSERLHARQWSLHRPVQPDIIFSEKNNDSSPFRIGRMGKLVNWKIFINSEGNYTTNVFRRKRDFYNRVT